MWKRKYPLNSLKSNEETKEDATHDKAGCEGRRGKSRKKRGRRGLLVGGTDTKKAKVHDTENEKGMVGAKNFLNFLLRYKILFHLCTTHNGMDQIKNVFLFCL